MAEEYLENTRLSNLPVPPGAEPIDLPTPTIQTVDINGKILSNDLRVKIRVPDWYFTGLTSGYLETLKRLRGIIFPYTPSISYELKADYSSVVPLHSNFPINFYKSSTVGSISINGKFTVENIQEAENYMATVHLLRALTRMKFGTDPDAGSPPPVCRLDAYGDASLMNVPVSITSFRVELGDDIDYFEYNKNLVPTRTTISITCLPMYSRREMQAFSVNSYINSSNFKGYI